MFKVEINTNNAAFDDNGASEIARLLRKVAVLAADGFVEGSGTLRDSNGNTVGTWSAS